MTGQGYGVDQSQRGAGPAAPQRGRGVDAPAQQQVKQDRRHDKPEGAEQPDDVVRREGGRLGLGRQGLELGPAVEVQPVLQRVDRRVGEGEQAVSDQQQPEPADPGHEPEAEPRAGE